MSGDLLIAWLALIFAAAHLSGVAAFTPRPARARPRHHHRR